MKKHKQPEEIAPETVPEENTPAPAPVVSHSAHTPASSVGRVAKVKEYFATHQKVRIGTIAAGVLLLLLLVLPFTRYTVLGLVIKKDVSVKVVDSGTGNAVSEATVKIAGKTQNTDSEGVAKLSGVSVGSHKIEITKKYYADSSEDGFVGLKPKTIEKKLTAQGVPLSLKIVNTIDRKPAKDIEINSDGSKVISDSEGKVTLVAPPDKLEIEAKLHGEGFNDKTIKINVLESRNKETEQTVTPAGKIYLLSKQSGKIDVVKTNLDGTERQVVLPGTGFESERETTLLASRDWKYLALKSKRDNRKDYNALYFIDTSNDKLVTMDEGNANFNFNGWSGHNLVYNVERRGIGPEQADRERLKSFDATQQKLITLDSTRQNNNSGESYGLISITDTDVIFMKSPVGGYYCDAGRPNGIYTVKSDGTQKKAAYEVPLSENNINSYSAYTYKPGEIYFEAYPLQCYGGSSQSKFYEYELGGKVEAIEESKFVQERDSYKNFLVSPDGKETVWSEARDGKNLIFIGNIELEDGKEITRLQELDVYGWYGKEYILLSKKGSELYIMPRTGGEPVKITDYHKPNVDFRGYGYGYGGL